VTVKACIFDLDGVIVDTARFHYLAWKKLADLLGIRFTEIDNERLKGVSRMASLEIILEIGNVSLDADLKEKYASLKNEWYIEYISRMTPQDLLPGTLQFVTELKSADIRTALGSASKNTPLILDRVEIRHLFDVVVDGNIVHNAKPDPEVFIKGAALLDIGPSSCVVFEDATAGIEAGLNAGMFCVGIGSASILRNAHYVVGGLHEMNLQKLFQITENR
jgi:beta-phosphoglucomutase